MPGSAVTTGTLETGVSRGGEYFSGRVASREQQHSAMRRGGVSVGSVGGAGLALWQQPLLPGSETARFPSMGRQHQPGGNTKTRLVITATIRWMSVYMTIHSTHECEQEFTTYSSPLLNSPLPPLAVPQRFKWQFQ